MDQGVCKKLGEAFHQMENHRRELLKINIFFQVVPSIHWALDSMKVDRPRSAQVRTSTIQKTEGKTLSHSGKIRLS